MSLFIPIQIADLEVQRELPSRSYKLDLEQGRIFENGSIDGMEAAQQAFKKALLTPRFRCLIYDNQYGSEIKQTIIAEDVTQAFVETDMPRLIKDATLVDSRFLDVDDFEISFNKDEAHVSCDVQTIFGDTRIEGVF